ncbi:hypothetical protein B0T25DRAFT_306476 [Lasiosphaeria hispida]|uniref:Heterokaryon incompatibility domain-containing protein n=1 Tax=Lasiosphaeria hispida TaxID=260671 RepID=A0AAJ0M989_9PEZI|nr:hypothetical protein B0T25DRAFT_306476 [Lasiosphaeria hispida]
MDHIQLPRDGLEHIQVPFVAELQFDSQDFATFHKRAAFPAPEDAGKWHDITSDQTASFVQAWLYFGLIAAFLECPIDIAQFTIEEGSPPQSFVSSLTFGPLLDEWSRSAAADRSSQRQRRRAVGLLNCSLAAIRRFEALPQSAVPPLPEVLLSVDLLIATLGTVAFGDGFDTRGASREFRDELGALLRDLRLVPRTQRTTSSAQGPVAGLLKRGLSAQGWCPFKVRHMFCDFSHMAIYYLSRLRDPTPLHITHANCTEERCIGNNVDMTNYMTRHTKPSCACSHSSVPEAEVRSIISDGGIPVVRIRSSRDGHISLEVKKALPHVRYIAISHVWSDGLGNPHANSLPHCQLLQLARSLKVLMPPMFDLARATISIPQLNISLDGRDMTITWGSTEWFWLDTLCIPVGTGAQVASLKTKAINQMAAIYSGAQQVLVLDSVMQRFTVAGRDACHVLAQLSAIAWLGRCWTYQEGALAWSLQIQCSDCSFDPVLFDQDLSNSNDEMYLLLPGTTTGRSTLYRLVMAVSLGCRMGIREVSKMVRDVLKYPPVVTPGVVKAALFEYIYRELRFVVAREICSDRRDEFSLRGDPLREFVQCWNALARRTTTMPADIHVIFANLLRLNAFSILALPDTEARMRAIMWSLFPHGLPFSLLYNKSKHRVRPAEQHCARWMPLWPDQHLLSESHVLEFRDEGLVLDCRPGGSKLDDPVALLLLDNLYMTKGHQGNLLVQDVTHEMWYRVAPHRQTGDSFDSTGFLTTAIILESQPKEGWEHARGTGIAAACLHVNQISTDILQDSGTGPKLKAVFDCPATVWPIGPAPVSSQDASLPIFSAQSKTHFALVLEHDIPTASQQPTLPRRPEIIPFMGTSAILIALCGPFTIILAAMTALLIFQAIKDIPPPPVSTTLYLTLALHSYTLCHFIPIPVFALIPGIIAGFSLNLIPFLAGLVHLGLKRAEAGLGGVDTAVAVLLAAGHGPQIAMVLFAKWYVNQRLYSAWLDTYDPGWTPERSDRWMMAVHGLLVWLWDTLLK